MEKNDSEFEPLLIRAKDIAKMTGMSVSAVYQRKDGLPKPLQLPFGSVRWRKKDIDNWIDQLPYKD